MKLSKLLLLSCLCSMLLPAMLFGQSPQSVTYQAVIRDGGMLVTNELIGVEFSLQQNGVEIYRETHAPTTNDFGLFTAVIGEGAVLTGNFKTIDWSQNNYELKVRVDIGGGLMDLGQNELHSVPYSLYTQKAHELDSLPYVAGNGIVINGSTIENTAPDQSVSLTGNGATSVSGTYPNFTISSTDNVNDADADPSNEIQSMSLSGATLTLSNGGGTLTLPTGTTYTAGSGINIIGSTISNAGDADADPANEIQNISLSGSNLSLSNGGGSVSLPSTTYTGGTGINVSGTTINNTGDADADPVNEIQNISLSGSNLSLSNGGGSVSLPSTTYTGGTGINVSGTTINNTGDADADPVNEIQNISLSGSNLSLSNGGGSVSLPSTTYTGGTGINVSGTTINNTGDADADPANEIQNISLSGSNLSLSNGGGSVSLPSTTYTGGTGINVSGTTINNTGDADADPVNEIQSLSLSGSNLSLTNGGGSVSLPNTTYTGGVGINVSGTNIINTGDTDASDDITTSTAASGDLSGTYPAPTVNRIRGRNVTATAPSNGQVYKWNGTAWAPANDNGGGASVWSTSGSDAYYNNGDVGIGTTSIDAKLEVFQNSSLSDPHILLHENGNDYARLNMKNNNGSNYWSIAAYIATNHRNDRLNFWNGTGGDVMTITGDGEVGIGVGISPKTTFHVGNGRRVLFGIDTLGNGDKLMFLPDLHAFRVGTVATGAASTYWNRDSIGLYSFASGYNTRAQGFGATAMGRDTEATNSYAFASGFFSNADGQYSTAMGFNTDAFALGSTALGYSTDAEANYSFAAGYFAEAQAIYSIAIGNAVRAQSYASMAVGRYNVGGGSATSWVSSDPIFEIGVGTGPSTRANAMTVRKNGNVGIGTTFPGARLHVANGELRIGSLEEISDGGSFLLDFSATLRPLTNNGRSLGNSSKRWNTVYATNGTINTSDRREKENISAIPYGLNEIMQLEPVIFSWIDQPERGNKLGLIAQDVQPILEEVVLDKEWVENEESGEIEEVEAERMGLYYSDIIPVLIKAVQEQQELIDTQSQQLEVQSQQLEALKVEVEALKKQ